MRESDDCVSVGAVNESMVDEECFGTQQVGICINCDWLQGSGFRKVVSIVQAGELPAATA
jgi:hypothetical protein